MFDKYHYHFQLNQVETFEREFEYRNLIHTEFIQCEILEYTDDDGRGNPTELRVNQVYNLEEYLYGDKSKSVERILRVGQLKPLQFKRSV